MSHLKKIHSQFFFISLLLIFYSCGIKVTGKKNVVYRSSGLLFVTSNRDFIFCKIPNKKMHERQGHNLLDGSLKGFSIYGKYDKCLSQKLNNAYIEWKPYLIVGKSDFNNSCKTEQLNSLLYEADSVKLIPVSIEYRYKEKVHIVGEAIILAKEQFCFRDNKGNIQKVTYTVNNDFLIYSVNVLE